MINSTKSPASGAGNLNQPSLMSQGANFAMRLDQRASAVGAVRCKYFLL